jgi:N6-adenosine-specific RNA methylase IME4
MRTIAKARAEAGGASVDGSPDDDGIEIARLAELGEVEYERERKTAAERLGVRAQILDRLVAAERTRLEALGGGGGGKKGQGQAIKLIEPEPWDDPVDGAELLDEIAKTLGDYVIFGNEHAARAIATWVVFTYTVDTFMFAPRLCITSPVLRCGKTTLLDVIFCMVRRPLLTSNVSPAALFRTIEMYQPCVLIDEGDTFLELSEELRGILNSGHRKGQGVLRIVGDDLEPRLFKTFSACALALIGLPPATVTDRSIMIELHRKRPSDKTTPFRLDRIEPLETLARQAARWVQDHAIEIGATEAELPPEIYNRAADNWRIMKKIAIVAGGNWPGYIDSAARAAAMIGGDQDLLVQLLADIRDIEFVYVIEDGVNKPEYEAEGEIPSAVLVQKLIELQGRPWAAVPDKHGKEGKPLSQNKLARMLKPLAIAPEQIGPKRVSGYRRFLFNDAFTRYLSDEGGSQPLNPSECDEMGTSCISQPLMTETEREVGKCEKSNNDGQERGREVANGGNGALAQEADPDAPPKPPWPGLSQKAVLALAREFAGWAAPEDGIRNRIAQYGATGEAVEIDTQKVLVHGGGGPPRRRILRTGSAALRGGFNFARGDDHHERRRKADRPGAVQAAQTDGGAGTAQGYDVAGTVRSVGAIRRGGTDVAGQPGGQAAVWQCPLHRAVAPTDLAGTGTGRRQRSDGRLPSRLRARRMQADGQAARFDRARVEPVAARQRCAGGNAVTELVKYDAACRAIAEAKAVDEVKDWHDKAEAMRAYARQAKNPQLEADAWEIKKRAEDRLGALSAALDKAHVDGHTGNVRLPSGGKSKTDVLAEAGISTSAANRYEQFSRLSADEKEARIVKGRKAIEAGKSIADAIIRAGDKANLRAERERELAARQTALPNKRYGVIYADPEWRFEVYSRETGMDLTADNHYPTSPTEKICNRSVSDIAADDCVLFLWATVPMLPQALKVMETWGFAYKSHCTWTKDRIGTGYWFRNKHELLLVGTKGNVPAPAPGTQWPSAIGAPRGRHSEKPEKFYELIEGYFPNLPKIELNARRSRAGWDAWGYEAQEAAQ